MRKKDITLLDCTLRDGGYYNNWDFPKELANDYIQTMKAVGVDVVEIGFRFLNGAGFKGPFSFTTDNFLHSLWKNKKIHGDQSFEKVMAMGLCSYLKELERVYVGKTARAHAMGSHDANANSTS